LFDRQSGLRGMPMTFLAILNFTYTTVASPPSRPQYFVTGGFEARKVKEKC
jgi:hypothetical protein